MSNKFKNTETIQTVEESINNILKKVELTACVIETSELYEADTYNPDDMKYQDLPMYEANIEDEYGETVSETTGRYCDLSSVKDELEAFAVDLSKNYQKKPESFCPMCCHNVTYNPENSECDDCGAAIPDGVIELEESSAQYYRETLKLQTVFKHLGYTTKEVENFIEATPVLYIQPEHDKKPEDPSEPDTVRYFAVGQVKDGLFSGLIHGYEGGGEYSEHCMHEGKYMPHDSDGESIEDETMENTLSNLIDRTFMDRCHSMLKKYIKYSIGGYFYEIIDRDALENFQPVYFDKPDYANTTFGNPAKYWSNEEYLMEIFEIYKLAKERIEFHYLCDSARDSKTLISTTLEEMRHDLTCSPFFTDKMEGMVNSYLSMILDDMDVQGYTLKTMNIMDCDICISCNMPLLANDELYESHKGESLCASCSRLCDRCEKYFTKEEVSRKEGFCVCGTCMETEMQN